MKDWMVITLYLMVFVGFSCYAVGRVGDGAALAHPGVKVSQQFEMAYHGEQVTVIAWQ